MVYQDGELVYLFEMIHQLSNKFFLQKLMVYHEDGELVDVDVDVDLFEMIR